MPGTPTTAPPLRTTAIEDDPFSMTLPPSERIFFILAAYFVAVVPLNFLVLKKLKRGELAWFTAPVISLGFAGVLFTSAGSLYSAKMSTVSNGIVVGQEGDPEGVFLGNTQMFIPRAGSYDLKLKNVDTLGAVQANEFGRMSGYTPYEDGSRDFEPVDTGEIGVPDLVANNLTFRRITYRQRVPIGSWLHLKLRPEHENVARCEVTNSGPYTIHNASLAVGSQLIQIGDVFPGKHIEMPVKFEVATMTEGLASDDVRIFTLNKSRVALTGQIDGFVPGPQIGASIPGRSRITLAMFSAWEGTSK